MDDRFVTLASLVAGVAPAPAPVVSSVTAKANEARPSVAAARPMLDLARAEVVQELALMRIAALEAFERAGADLLHRLAHDVLARELALAPADVCALAARALAMLAEMEPVAIVVAPADAAAFETALPLRVDASLDAGDLVIDVTDGAFESRYALRVREAIARVAGEYAG